MDNTVVLPAVIAHAETLWRVSRGQRVDDAIHQGALRFIFGDHRGNMAERTAQLMSEQIDSDFYKDQPKQQALTKKWRSKFEPRLSLSEQEAQRFIIEACSSPELMDGLFTDHAFSGVTVMEQGHINDVPTIRPAGKLRGWSLNLSTSGMGSYNCIRQNLFAGPGDMVLLSPEAMYDYRRAGQLSHWTRRRWGHIFITFGYRMWNIPVYGPYFRVRWNLIQLKTPLQRRYCSVSPNRYSFAVRAYPVQQAAELSIRACKRRWIMSGPTSRNH